MRKTSDPVIISRWDAKLIGMLSEEYSALDSTFHLSYLTLTPIYSHLKIFYVEKKRPLSRNKYRNEIPQYRSKPFM